MQSTQFPPKRNKAGNDVSNRVKNLQACEETQHEDAESQKRKARDTELDTSGELIPLRKMTDREKVAAAAARNFKADLENSIEKTMEKMLDKFATKLDKVETEVKDRLDQVETQVTTSITSLSSLSSLKGTQ